MRKTTGPIVAVPYPIASGARTGKHYSHAAQPVVARSLLKPSYQRSEGGSSISCNQILDSERMVRGLKLVAEPHTIGLAFGAEQPGAV